MPVKRLSIMILFVLVLILAGLGPASAATTDPDRPEEDAEKVEDTEGAEPKNIGLTQRVIVTATRSEEDVFQVPQPVSVITSEEIEEESPNSATDLLRRLPGVDVNGVGTSQPRPIIRGQRGQRILLMEDGIRMNTSRRQSDFGELPALVDVGTLERIEVVRGPGSVLYGSDAIGGVVNMITRPARQEDGFQVTTGFRFSSADEQMKPSVNTAGRQGKFHYSLGATYRDSSDYEAPAGTFGNITLAEDATVNDTGVTDRSFNARVGWDFTNGHELFVKAERYDADETGFGFVEPSLYDPESSTRIALTYPFQKVDQFVVGYKGNYSDRSWVDSAETTFSYRRNKRRFDQDIDVTFFPGAGIEILSENFTDIETFGLRSEGRKVAHARHVLTYGIDYYSDDAASTNTTQETMYGFGPPMVTIDDTPTLPDATYDSLGLFIQDRVKFCERFDAIIGARYQDVTAKTRTTPGIPETDNFKSTDSTGVWATNLIYKATDYIRIVGSVGTAFRSPNLIERFYDGPTPEGGAFQSRNLDLEAETSLNVDLGFKYSRDNVYLEAAVFRNTIEDGITIRPTGEIIDELPEYQNVNVEKLRFEGVELALDWMFVPNWSVGLNYTHLTEENISSGIDAAIGNSFSDKVNLNLRYQSPNGRYWAEYMFRHNGDQRDAVLDDNPIGDIYPAFTVHSLRGGMRMFRTKNTVHRLGIAVENLTNELYAEFSNASFFRPEPERSVIVNYVFDLR